MHQLTFHLIGNAHLDPVWLWDWREGLNEGLITCRTIADLMDEDPDLTFSRGESAIYEHIERTDPALFDRIRRHVENGRWELVGGSYVQSDENLPDTETLLRQYVRGQQYFASRFSRTVEVGWSADCFGHSAGMPEILGSAGIRYFAFTRPSAPALQLARPAFWWVGSGGSRVLAYRPLGRWYGTERSEVSDRLDKTLEQGRQQGLTNVGVFYGLGNHGGGPTRRQLADIRAWAAAHPDIRIVFSTMHRLFHELEAEVATKTSDFLPTHVGEINFFARGCYSSLARLKFLYRRAQAAVVAAESTDAVIAAQFPQPAADLGEAWDSLLFNGFHDILPGTSIERACDDQIAHLGLATRHAQAIELRALNGLATRVDTSVRPAEHPDMPRGTALLVWNPHPYPFDGYVEMEADLDYRPIERYRLRPEELPVRLLDAAGRPLPFQSIPVEHNFAPHVPWRKRVVTPVKLPPMGWSVMEMAWVEGAPSPARPIASDTQAMFAEGAIQNGVYRVTTHPGAPGVTVYRGGSILFGGDGLSAAVFHDPWSSWGAWSGRQDDNASHPLKENWTVTDVRVLERGPWRAALWVRLAGEGGRLDLTFRLTADSDELEVLARVFWDERLARLKLQLPMRDTPQAEFEVPGGCVTRGPSGQVPGNRWLRVSDATGPRFGFVSDALADFDCTDGQFRVTVVRSSRYAYGQQVIEDHPWQPPADSGELTFRFLLTAADANLPRRAQQWAHQPVVLPVPTTPGPLPREGSLLKVEPAGVRLLALKPAADGNGWILRLQETTGQPVTPKVTFLGHEIAFEEIPAGRIATWRITLSDDAIIVCPCNSIERDSPPDGQ